MSLLIQLAVFAVTLIVLVVISRWIAHQVQILGLRLTRDHQIAVMTYYLLLLPGILLHELSHLVMARLLGLKVGKFTLWPRRTRGAVELGSVTITSGGVIRDSLVGLAPFLGGTVVLLLVGYAVFDVAELGRAWAIGGGRSVLAALDGIWLVPDVWLWAYVIFVVSNAMVPSPADRQPWLVAGLYTVGALILGYLLGGLPSIPESVSTQVAGVLQVLTLAFIFTLAIDLLFGLVLWIAELVVIEAQRGLGR
jgi:hypothetical protein